MPSPLLAPNPASLDIGGIVIELTRNNSTDEFLIQPSHIPFLAKNNGSDIQLVLHNEKTYRRIPNGTMIFDSNGTWKLFRNKKEWIFRFFAYKGNKRVLLRTLITNESFTRGKLFIEPFLESFRLSPNTPLILFSYPLDELLLVHYLAHHKLGSIIHAFGISHQEKGYAFIGASGAGKSTLARLWQSAGDSLLSDDRLIVKKGQNGHIIYGTPWHGDADAAAQLNAPLNKVYFLAKAQQNYLFPLKPMEAVKRFFVCCFPPFHNIKGMSFLTDYFTQIASEIPCYELGVLPDTNIVDFVHKNS